MHRPPIETPVNFHTALERAKTYYRSSRHWKMLEGTPWENDAAVLAADLMMDVQAYWLNAGGERGGLRGGVGGGEGGERGGLLAAGRDGGGP